MVASLVTLLVIFFVSKDRKLLFHYLLSPMMNGRQKRNELKTWTGKVRKHFDA